MPRKFGAELLGTGLLVYVAVGVATLSFGPGFALAGSSFSLGVLITALAFGLVLLGLAYALGPISGAHVNPAVTLGMWLSRRMSLGEAIGYWVAQFAGGLLGALLLWATFNGSPSYNRTKTGLGADGYGSASHLHATQGGAFLVEVILTAIFVFVVLSVTGKKGTGPISGVAIGLSLAMVHLVGIPLTGTSVNPARSLGPAVVVGGTAMSQVWLFLVAPLAGAVVAAVLHRFFESGAAAS